MNVWIYQIGNIPVYEVLSSRSDGGVEVDIPRKWHVPTEDLKDTGGRINLMPSGRTSPEAVDISVKGDFFETSTMPAMSFVNQINSLGGFRDVPIIGFRLASQPNGSQPILHWLTMNVTIESVDVEFSYKDTEWKSDVVTVDIKMKGEAYWRSLNSSVWSYSLFNHRGDQKSFSISHPKYITDINKNYSFVQRIDNNTIIHNPSLWGVFYKSDPFGSFGFSWTSSLSNYVYSHPYFWSGEPISYYAFKNLDLNNQVSIEVVKNDGSLSTSTLNTNDLHTILVARGYYGLRPSDIIIAGKTNPLPGFVIREGNVIPVVAPWIKQDVFVGRVGIGESLIKVTVNNSGILQSQLHIFQSY